MKSTSSHDRRSWRARLADDVDPRLTQLPIMACCAVTGLCDTVVFNAAGVFVGMQTGNTIFLALGAAHLPPLDTQLWLKALVSIFSFWAGCFCFGHLRRFGPRRKSTLFFNFLLQAALLFVVAAMAQAGAISQFVRHAVFPHRKLHGEESGSLLVLLPVGLLAFQFGGQVVCSRMLGFNEVPTSVLTSLYCDLLSDPRLFARVGTNEKRDRRVLAMLTLLVGGIVGAWLQRTDVGMPPAIWIAGVLKFMVAVSWLFWRSKTEEESKA
ncbi:hypothetical protein TD95_005400 [Thielaviopsis punctulata]|uniref:DUF1275 domain protein n=1 Tax=Thielaviopsis punctulata TaxID=72032 RepID=A0A0F4Z9U4_9PEZI|nr:hypothetical protein TD95_005400 [Thielaviopsis punctulata]